MGTCTIELTEREVADIVAARFGVEPQKVFLAISHEIAGHGPSEMEIHNVSCKISINDIDCGLFYCKEK